MKPLVYTTETQTVSDFIGVDNINADPAHQRPQIQDNSKRKGIVQAMVDGINRIMLKNLLKEKKI